MYQRTGYQNNNNNGMNMRAMPSTVVEYSPLPLPRYHLKQPVKFPLGLLILGTIALIVCAALFLTFLLMYLYQVHNTALVVNVSPTPDTFAQVQFSLAVDLNSITDPVVYAYMLATQIATAMGIQTNQIIIVSITSGSVIVDALFVAPTAAALAVEFITQTGSPGSVLLSQPLFEALIEPATIATELSECRANLCVDQTSSSSSSSSSSGSYSASFSISSLPSSRFLSSSPSSPSSSLSSSSSPSPSSSSASPSSSSLTVLSQSSSSSSSSSSSIDAIGSTMPSSSSASTSTGVVTSSSSSQSAVESSSTSAEIATSVSLSSAASSTTGSGLTSTLMSSSSELTTGASSSSVAATAESSSSTSSALTGATATATFESSSTTQVSSTAVHSSTGESVSSSSSADTLPFSSSSSTASDSSTSSSIASSSSSSDVAFSSSSDVASSITQSDSSSVLSSTSSFDSSSSHVPTYCEMNANPCQFGGTCTSNTTDTYVCQCDEISDGVNCEIPPGYDFYYAEGQSNTVGMGGTYNPAIDLIDPRVEQYYNCRNMAGRIGPYTEPTQPTLCQASGFPYISFVSTFARNEAKKLPKNRRIAIINNAVGGTSFKSHWQSTHTLAMTSRLLMADAAQNALTSVRNVNRCRGILWLQGESDAGANSSATSDWYVGQLGGHIDLLRGGWAPLCSEVTPVIVGSINTGWAWGTGGCPNSGNCAIPVLNALRNVSIWKTHSCFASADDFTDPMALHFNSADTRNMGNKFSTCLAQLETVDNRSLAFTAPVNYPLAELITYLPFNDTTFSDHSGTRRPISGSLSSGATTVLSVGYRETIHQKVLTRPSAGTGNVFLNNVILPAQFTVSFWMFNTFDNSIGNTGIITANTHLNDFGFTINNGRARVQRLSNGATAYCDDTIPLPGGQWNHFAATFNATTGNMILYINSRQACTHAAGLTPNANNIWRPVPLNVVGSAATIARLRVFRYPQTIEEITSLRQLDSSEIGFFPFKTGFRLFLPLNGSYNDYSPGVPYDAVPAAGPAYTFPVDAEMGTQVLLRSNAGGATDYLTLPHTYITANFTMMMYYKTPYGTTANLVGAGYNGAQSGLSLVQVTQGGKLVLAANVGTGAAAVRCVEPTPYLIDVWQHTAFSFDASTGTIKQYRNGALVCNIQSAAVLFQGGSTVIIASFQTFMSNFRLYDYVVSDAEVQARAAEFTAIIPPPFPAASVMLNLTLSTDLTDSKGGYDVQYLNAAGTRIRSVSLTPPNFPTALDAQSPITILLNLPISFTKSYWIRTAATTDVMYTMINQGSPDVNGAHQIYINANNQICVRLYAGGSPSNHCSANGLFVNSVWQHHALTYNAVSRQFNLYIDGVKKFQVSSGSTQGGAWASLTNGLPLQLGVDAAVHATQRAGDFYGAMVLDKALSPAEASQLYLQTAPALA